MLRAAQSSLDEGIAAPILIGRPAVIEARIAKAKLRMRLGEDVESVNPESDVALSPVLGDLPPADGPQRHHAGGGEGRGAALQHPHRLR